MKYSICSVFLLAISPFIGLAQGVSDSTSLSREELKSIMEEYLTSYSIVFASGSSEEDVEELYSFYTDDFTYNHPKYGGIYTRELLFNNTIKYLKKGSYNDSPRRETLNMIIGLDAVAIEQQYENEENTTMTLFKFRGDKIFYVEEFW